MTELTPEPKVSAVSNLRHAGSVLGRGLVVVGVLMLFVLPSLVTWWVTFRQVETRELDRVPEQHLLIAQILGRNLESQLITEAERFFMLAEEAEPELVAQASHLSGFRRICVTDPIGAADAQGCNMLLDAAVPEGARFQTLELERGNLQLSGVVLVDDAPALLLVHKAEGRQTVGVLSTDVFRALQGEVSFGDHAHAAVFDQNGRVIAHPNADWVASARDISAVKAVDLALTEEAGVTQFYSPAFSSDMVAGYVNLSRIGWGVIVPQPVTELTAMARDTALGSTLPTVVSLSVFLCTLLLMALLGERYMAVMRDALDELSGPTRRAPDAPREVTMLGEFRGLARRLKTVSREVRDAQDMERRWRQQLETNLKIARDLADREKQLRELTERSTQKDRLEALGLLVGSVAHDFNNLLGIVRAQSEMIGFSPEARSDALRAALSEIDAATDRGKTLTNQLLSSSGRSRLDPQLVDPGEAVRRAMGAASALVADNVVLEAEIPDAYDSILVDPEQLHRALLDLVRNADEAIEGAGRICLRVANLEIARDTSDAYQARKPRHCLRITVEDTGRGMTADERARACEPFYTTKGFGAGSGLGLSMAAGFAQQSGGCLRLESDPGLGTRAHLTFPARQAGQHKGDAPQSPARLSARRLLLVEDEPALRLILKSLFEREGLQVTAAETGDEAMELLAKGYRPELVVTDVVMPGQTQGDVLVSHIRGRFGPIPVVVMSGYSDSMNRERVDLGTPLVFVQKPVTAGKILEHLAQMETA